MIKVIFLWLLVLLVLIIGLRWMNWQIDQDIKRSQFNNAGEGTKGE